jgi:hypothetical protein
MHLYQTQTNADTETVSSPQFVTSTKSPEPDLPLAKDSQVATRANTDSRMQFLRVRRMAPLLI